MKDVIKSTKFIPSKRQAPNLRKLLTKAKFTTKSNEGSHKCNDKRCATCPYLKETKQIHITSTDKYFNIREKLTCKSSNVLYIITCGGCNQQYVGMTTQKLAGRFTIHRQHIDYEQYRKIGVSEHLANARHPQQISPSHHFTDSIQMKLLAK